MACLNHKCQDPCPGVCGFQAECRVINHVPICSCVGGHTGNAFTRCYPVPLIPAEPVRDPYRDPCIPSPCGQYGQCRVINADQYICSCLPSYVGSPPNCRPECLINSDCSSQEACLNEHCRDPCPGSCGINALCMVINHIPNCICSPGYIGDPFTRCIIPEIPKPTRKNLSAHSPTIIPQTFLTYYPLAPPAIADDPCNPSPCGPNAKCHEGLCSCLPEYQGDPYVGCRPECILNSECSRNLACINQKCRDPCPGTCADNAICSVHNHVPMCHCPVDMEGDAFILCRQIPKRNYNLFEEKPHLKGTISNNHSYISLVSETINPCSPSPCGPNSQCREKNGQSICSCLPDMIGFPPSCRPECISDSECPPNRACVNQKCQDPCPGSCGHHALCNVVNHIPICSCHSGYTGSPFVACQPISMTFPKLNIRGYISNQSVLLVQQPPQNIEPANPCIPSPCGPYSTCNVVHGSASCKCLHTYIGTPPYCRPECVSNSECQSSQACINQKCQDPCPGLCGQNAECRAFNHIGMCLCLPGYEGDPFTNCHRISAPISLPPVPMQKPTAVVTSNRYPVLQEHIEPCVPNPCGSNAECLSNSRVGSCVCLPNFFGNPYEGCRPECVLNSDCPSSKACIQTKCQDPCPGICGQNAVCLVTNHLPSCNCYTGYSGDPYRICHAIQESKEFNRLYNSVQDNLPSLISLETFRVGEPVVYVNPCVPSPCGHNAQCREINQQAVCSCLPEFVGIPPACRPECTTNSECPLSTACVNRKCQDPCPGACGHNAECRVINHNAICSCLPEYMGDAFSRCYPKPPPIRDTPDIINLEPAPRPQYPTTSRPTIIDEEPSPRPQHPTTSRPPIIFEESKPTRKPTLHVTIPSTPPTPLVVTRRPLHGHLPAVIAEEPINPCYPSPCGFYAQCHNRRGVAICTCLSSYVGTPPNCRPECTIHSDCPAHLACFNSKCSDPCPGSCGFNARCQVVNHVPICICHPGLTGDPFEECREHKVAIQYNENTPPSYSEDPCEPSPCGANSKCHEGLCSCLPEYQGDPYVGCRPECVVNNDCARDRSCIQRKCKDPCPGTCGNQAMCHVINHIPICSCPLGMTGNAFVHCEPLRDVIAEDAPKNPCYPNPCGPNSHCLEVRSQAVCSCITGYMGSPPSCRPECTSNAECSGDKYCLNQKCHDACVGACGVRALCRAYDHLPRCTCPPRYQGNPYVQCSPIGSNDKFLPSISDNLMFLLMN
ncbi:uncharacterized protein LOC142227620 [Haematobia irritans]|uniref:uncharacterized protein LOC142227620 n=1 Tax=Haematobia irritans TaxID=7368 RepID=UPI003F503D27